MCHVLFFAGKYNPNCAIPTHFYKEPLPYTYLWTTNETSQDISGLTAGWYVVTITDGNTCQVLDSIKVELALVIPNIITPNEDGKNDDFFITNIDAYQKVTVEIFGRWGDKIFSFSGTGIEYNQSDIRFDGTLNGAKLPMGSYVYIVSIDEEEPFTGSILIKY